MLMVWTCEECGEIHGDRFEACWKCTPNSDHEPDTQQSEGHRKVIEFSLRTMLLTVMCLAFLMSAIVNFDDDESVRSLLVFLVAYVSCWIVLTVA